MSLKRRRRSSLTTQKRQKRVQEKNKLLLLVESFDADYDRRDKILSAIDMNITLWTLCKTKRVDFEKHIFRKTVALKTLRQTLADLKAKDLEVLQKGLREWVTDEKWDRNTCIKAEFCSSLKL